MESKTQEKRSAKNEQTSKNASRRVGQTQQQQQKQKKLPKIDIFNATQIQIIAFGRGLNRSCIVNGFTSIVTAVFFSLADLFPRRMLVLYHTYTTYRQYRPLFNLNFLQMRVNYSSIVVHLYI